MSFLDEHGLTNLVDKIKSWVEGKGYLTTHQDISGKVDKTDPRLSDARTPIAHTHDDRYYTESEIDTKLSGIGSMSITYLTTVSGGQSINISDLYQYKFIILFVTNSEWYGSLSIPQNEIPASGTKDFWFPIANNKGTPAAHYSTIGRTYLSVPSGSITISFYGIK